MDSAALGRSGSAESVLTDVEAGLITPLLPPGSFADQEPEPKTSEIEEVEQKNEEVDVTSSFVSKMGKVVRLWWSSSELTPCKPKLFMSRLLFVVTFTALLLLAFCGALILTYIVVMMILVPRVVVVNYLVDPYMADSPDWGPTLIAFASAVILGALFILDDWAERTYGKEWFGLCDWSDSWICMAAQVVLLYLFFETVYISLSTFILSFLTVSPKVASIGLMFVSASPVNVLALLLASATIAIVLAIFVYCTTRKIDAAVDLSNDEHSSPMKSLAWNTLVFVDTIFRVIHYIFLGFTILCCIYFIVYGSYELGSFVIRYLTKAFFVHDPPDVIPFPSLD